MIVGYLHVIGVAIFPCKTQSKLVVNPDYILASALFFEPVQSVMGRRFQIIKLGGCVQHGQLPFRN